MKAENPEIQFKKAEPDYSGMMLQEVEFTRMRDAYGVEKAYRLDLMTREGDETPHKPVVFFVHGGGFTEPCDKRQNYISLFAQELTKSGYAVVSPDYPVYLTQEDRITAGPETIGCSLGGEALHRAALYIQDHGKELGLDGSRMALMGGSAGSMAGFYALALYPGDFKAFINLWGVPVLLPNVTSFPPVLSIHGDCDCLVSYGRELSLLKELELHGIFGRLITLEGCDHTPVRQRKRYLPDILAFLKEWL